MSRFAFTAEIEIEADDEKAAQTVFDGFMAKGIDGGFVERYSVDRPEELPEPREPKHYFDPAHYSADGDPAGYGDPVPLPDDDECEGGVCSAPDGAPENVSICSKHAPEVYGPRPRPRPASEDDVVDLSGDEDEDYASATDEWAAGEARHDWGGS